MRPLIIERLTDAGFGWLAWLVPTPGFGYALLLAVLAVMVFRRSVIAGASPNAALEAALAGAVGAAIGTRFFYLLVFGDLFRISFLEWFDWSAGTASWGAYLGAIGGLILYGALTGAGGFRYVDVAASCAGVGDVVGRWPCYLAGDDFGRVTDVPWALQFPQGSLPHNAHVAQGLLDPSAPLSLPVHPLQFYLMFNGLLVLWITTKVWRRGAAPPGRTLAAFLLAYGGTRFWWEFYREPDLMYTGIFSVSQWMCLGLVLAGAMLLLRERGVESRELRVESRESRVESGR